MRRYQQAFTLIEMMVTVVVLAIVFTIAIPSFNQQILNNNSLALAEDFAGALTYARTEAVKRGTRVSLCASNDGANCAGGWANGYIAYVDAATSDTATATSVTPNQVLRYWTGFNPRTIIAVTRNGTNITFIRYTGLGALARNGAQGTHEVRVVARLTGCTGTAQRTINIGLSGMVANATRTSCP